MLAPVLRPPLQQVSSEQIEVLGEVLRDEVNLAVWQRQLPAPVSDFATALLAQGEPLGHAIVLELGNPESTPNLSGLVDRYPRSAGAGGLCCRHSLAGQCVCLPV